MNVIFDMLLIQVVVCFIIDLSGFVSSMEEGLSKWLKIRAHIPRPFSCSLCMGWWCSIIYLIVTGEFSLIYITAAGLISFFSKNITGLIRWVSEFIIWIEGLLYRIIR